MLEKLSLIPPRPGVYLLKGAKEAVLYANRGEAYLYSRKYKRALEDYNQAITLGGKNA